MLEGLDSVPWGKLGHAYGKAADIPDLIRKLISHDETARKEAWHELYGNLWHQGTIYEATPHAVPFFIELAGNQDVPDRDWILHYLIALANGTSFNDAHRDLAMFAERRAAPEFEQECQRQLGWVRATRQAVSKGRHLYISLLKEASPLVRTLAAHLLGLFPEHAREHLACLGSHITSGEVNELARAICVLAVGRLGKQEKSAASWLESIFNADESQLVRRVAAVGLAWTMGEDLPDGAYSSLREYAMRSDSSATILDDLSLIGLDGDGDHVLDFLCREALGLVRNTEGQSLPELIKSMKEVAHYQSIDIARAVLEVVFGGEPMPSTMTSHGLSEEQRTALQAIATCQRLWVDLDHTVLDAGVLELMKAFGLPRHYRQLQAFLDGRLMPQDPNWSKVFETSTRFGSDTGP